MTDPTDYKLVSMCLEGDAVAWEILVNRYRKLIFHFPIRAGLGLDRADDVFQDTCLALFNRLSEITQKENLSYWIASVAQRATWKTIRETKKENHQDISEIYEVASQDLLPEEDLLIKIEQHHLRTAMASLDPKCRALLLELFFSDQENDYKAVADRFGMSLGSVGPTRNRCLQKLKKILKSKGVKINTNIRIKK